MTKLKPEIVGNTGPVLSRKVARDVPVAWAHDPLSEFWDAAAGNVIANFANDSVDLRLLRQIDGLLQRIAENLIGQKNTLVALLFLRTHAAFRAASLVATSGMPTEAYPLARTVLEHAGYALLIHRKPTDGETWLRRHDGPAEMRAARRAFTPTEIKAVLGDLDKGLQKIFEDLYEYNIDFGGHPNERSLTANLALEEHSSHRQYKVQYLHGDTMWVQGAIRSVARAGLFALFAFQHTMAAKFELLGVKAEINALRIASSCSA